MIPRTVQMAKVVASQLSPTELQSFGNIILNGYATAGPNTTGKLAWQYKETTGAPVPLPSVTSVQPVLRGWTTNYQEYYTQLQPNGYGINPGDPTMFAYSVHSYSQETGGILSFGGNGTWITGGKNYTPGTYTNVPLIGGSGSGAQATIIVKDIIGDTGPILDWTQTYSGAGYPTGVFIANASTINTNGKGYGAKFDGGGSFVPPYDFAIFQMSNPGANYRSGDVLSVDGGTDPALVTVDTVGLKGVVTSVVITTPGAGYKVGDSVTATIPGGSGFAAPVGAITPTPGTGGQPQWAQTPRRFFQNQVSPFVPPTPNQQAIQYSYMYPVVDNPTEPPIDHL